MSTLKTITLLALCLLCSIGFAKPRTIDTDSLSGNITLTIDVSTLQDTAGVFKVRFGGDTFFPQIKDNKLIVNAHLAEPRRAYLTFYPRDSVNKDPNRSTDYIVARYNDYYTFFAHPGSFNIKVDNFIRNSQIVNASPYQKEYFDLEKKYWEFQTNYGKQHYSDYAKLNAATGKVKDSLIAVMQNIGTEAYRKHYDDVVLPFIKNHPDSPVALQQLEEYSYMLIVNYDDMESLYNNLTDRIKALPIARIVYNTIDRNKFATNLIGKPAPDFSIPDVAGKNISLKSFKGNVTLLEFWASWCGPCRANNPGLVRVYDKFKAKGFKVIGVSLDSKKDDWLAAIKTDKLTWTHVSELNSWNGKVSKTYHISAVPTNYLIGKDGKVLAQNLDEKELNEQLAKLLK